MAGGIADDLASTALLATDKPVLVAPAMNFRMWGHQATQENLARLGSRGVRQVGPNAGPLAENESGMGRMAEPLEIVDAVEKIFVADAMLGGRRALVTSGPTHEPIDRCVTSRTARRAGRATPLPPPSRGWARIACWSRGPTNEPDPPGVKVVHIETAREMLAACEAALPADIAICAAAVADWRADAATAKSRKKPARCRR